MNEQEKPYKVEFTRGAKEDFNKLAAETTPKSTKDLADALTQMAQDPYSGTPASYEFSEEQQAIFQAIIGQEVKAATAAPIVWPPEIPAFFFDLYFQNYKWVSLLDFSSQPTFVAGNIKQETGTRQIDLTPSLQGAIVSSISYHEGNLIFLLEKEGMGISFSGQSWNIDDLNQRNK